MIFRRREFSRFEERKSGVLLRFLVVYCGTIFWESRIDENTIANDVLAGLISED